MGAGSPRAPTEASTTLSAQRGLGWPPGGAGQGRGLGVTPRRMLYGLQQLPPWPQCSEGGERSRSCRLLGTGQRSPQRDPARVSPAPRALCARSFRSHLSKAGASGIICQSWPAPDAGDRKSQGYSRRSGASALV